MIEPFSLPVEGPALMSKLMWFPTTGQGHTGDGSLSRIEANSLPFPPLLQSGGGWYIYGCLCESRPSGLWRDLVGVRWVFGDSLVSIEENVISSTVNCPSVVFDKQKTHHWHVKSNVLHQRVWHLLYLPEVLPWWMAGLLLWLVTNRVLCRENEMQV